MSKFIFTKKKQKYCTYSSLQKDQRNKIPVSLKCSKHQEGKALRCFSSLFNLQVLGRSFEIFYTFFGCEPSHLMAEPSLQPRYFILIYILFMFLHACMRACVCVHTCHGQLTKVYSLLLPHRFWVSNSGHQPVSKHLYLLSHLVSPLFHFCTYTLLTGEIWNKPM